MDDQYSDVAMEDATGSQDEEATVEGLIQAVNEEILAPPTHSSSRHRNRRNPQTEVGPIRNSRNRHDYQDLLGAIARVRRRPPAIEDRGYEEFAQGSSNQRTYSQRNNYLDYGVAARRTQRMGRQQEDLMDEDVSDDNDRDAGSDIGYYEESSIGTSADPRQVQVFRPGTRAHREVPHAGTRVRRPTITPSDNQRFPQLMQSRYGGREEDEGMTYPTASLCSSR
ncbi:hypothetical protein NM688_g3876 [Phlebia brevispora]|uniref:Uncharacterized protein n=1 Tax=Phlebia brevispora TaxID=194682 RepID=A0ACC1T4I0_9APHY|nr:hypothetical protein NM688_g3876 [Phlebia brevispora]